MAIGVTTNGGAIFNNAAAPPDTLAVESTTFDNYGGHSQNSGVFRHHATGNRRPKTENYTQQIGLLEN